MKSTQDISPSAILCLSLGLFIGGMFMPERQSSPHTIDPPIGDELPMMDTPLVDGNAGRLFERLPHSPRDEREAVYEAAEAFQATRQANQELASLLQRSAAGNTSFKAVAESDAAALMAVAVFAVLGAIVLYTDALEISEKEEQSGLAKKVALETAHIVCHAKHTQHPKAVITGTSVAIAAAVLICSVCICWQSAALSSSNHDASDNELRDLVAKSSVSNSAPDSIVILFVIAFALLGVAFMRVDIREISEQLRDETILDKVNAGAKLSTIALGLWQRLSNILLVSAMLVATTVLGVALYYFDDIENSGVVSHLITPEIENCVTLARNYVNSRPALISDGLLVMTTAVFSILGVAIMRVDVCEMAEQVQREAKQENIVSSASHVQEAKTFQFAQHALSIFIVLALGIIASLLAVVCWCFQSHDDAKIHHMVDASIMELEFIARPGHMVSHLHPSLASDGAICAAIGVFATLGAAFLYMDYQETVEQCHDASEDSSRDYVQKAD